MIYLFTALYPEAQGLISRYHLKKEISSGLRFQTFYNEREGIQLTITGAGEIAAACAVSSICIKYGAGVGDFLVNLGICAADATRGSLFFCHKLMEQATGKTFYPDILYAHECMEATLITSSVVQSQRKMQESTMQQKAEDIVLYDMEAAAVYQAGSYFFGPHQMSFLKVVSDFGEEQRIKPSDVAAIMDANADKIDVYLKMLKSLEETSEKSDPKAEEENLYQDLHCSETMRADLRQHLRYWKLSGIHYESVLEQMYEDGRLPCRDKREGKLRIEELKQQLL